MSGPSPTLETYANLNRVARQLFAQEAWTPAAGALIIAGVMPAHGCTGIPGQGVRLENLGDSATRQDLECARRLLDEWVECQADDVGLDAPRDDDHLRAILSARIKPIEFLIWCVDYDPGLRRPRLLDYFLAWIRDPKSAMTLLPVPVEIVDRAVALEGHDQIEKERVNRGSATIGPPATASAGRKAVPPYTFKDPLGAALRRAVAAVDDPVDADQIFDELFRIAESPEERKGTDLVGVVGRSLKYKVAGGGFNTVSISGLRERIKRQLEKLRRKGEWTSA
jgi:hypothetical protein